ncbi:MAG: transposase [Deltaproteobacteria bacterium]|jgi:transposase-like protein|nr:transposase [Deltaproteobacteria bacterium]MDL1984902.1 transposase [Deltaproteobacteria bacterium]MDL1988778.1 transposase [Deltaproteobacteria bacterium]
MTQKRKHYSKQFKINAVKLVTEQLYTVSIRFWGYKTPNIFESNFTLAKVA